jgi:hypothetical protein
MFSGDVLRTLYNVGQHFAMLGSPPALAGPESPWSRECLSVSVQPWVHAGGESELNL